MSKAKEASRRWPLRPRRPAPRESRGHDCWHHLAQRASSSTSRMCRVAIVVQGSGVGRGPQSVRSLTHADPSVNRGNDGGNDGAGNVRRMCLAPFLEPRPRPRRIRLACALPEARVRVAGGAARRPSRCRHRPDRVRREAWRGPSGRRQTSYSKPPASSSSSPTTQQGRQGGRLRPLDGTRSCPWTSTATSTA